MKKKLFEILLARELAPNETEARAIIMSGNVYVKGNKVDKAGTLFDEDVLLDVKQKEHPYVSRGGLKMEGAVKVFGLDVTNKNCIDIGSSTGGFTDCLLKNGAKSVTAVDVGVGELAWKLRQDTRVIVMEGTNARYLTRDNFDNLFDVAVTDVSFISLKHILPVMAAVTTDEPIIVSLIKPQFECERSEVQSGGIIKDANVHKSVVNKVKLYAQNVGLYMSDIAYSPIKGTKGNTEFLARYEKKYEKVFDERINNFIDMLK